MKIDVPLEAQYFGPGIYKFTHKKNGKIYIGQAQNIYKRHGAHRGMHHNNGRFGKAIKKYGFEAFDFEVLEKLEDLSLLDQREQYWMDFYQCYDPNKGYNIAVIASSGTKGRKRQASEFENGLKALAKQRIEVGHPWLGRNHSEFTKQILSVARKGKKLAPQTYEARDKAKRKRVVQIEIQTGKVVRFWDSATEVAKHFNVSTTVIYYALKGGVSHYDKRKKKEVWCCKNGWYKGFEWQYVTDEAIESDVKPRRPHAQVVIQAKKVAQINNQTGEVIRVWNSLGSLGRELKLSAGRISLACRDVNSPMYAGYRWEYVE